MNEVKSYLSLIAETELPSPANDVPNDVTEDFAEDEPIRLYEKRALNFLVNEYILLNDYKLTSVTFAEENEDQVWGQILPTLFPFELSLCLFNDKQSFDF